MKMIECGNKRCCNRRSHWERQDEMRPQQTIEVPDDYEGKSFCSFTCACEAGYFDISKGWIRDPKKAIGGCMTEQELRHIEERMKGEFWGYEQVKIDAQLLVSAVRSLQEELEDANRLWRMAVKERNAAWKRVGELENEINELLEK